MTGRVRSPRPAALIVFAAGIAMIAMYFGLRAPNVGKIGEPTDIGGGAVLLIGYIMSIGGLVWVVTDVVLNRSSRNRRSM